MSERRATLKITLSRNLIKCFQSCLGIGMIISKEWLEYQVCLFKVELCSCKVIGSKIVCSQIIPEKITKHIISPGPGKVLNLENCFWIFQLPSFENLNFLSSFQVSSVAGWVENPWKPHKIGLEKSLAFYIGYTVKKML